MKTIQLFCEFCNDVEELCSVHSRGFCFSWFKQARLERFNIDIICFNEDVELILCCHRRCSRAG